MGGTGGTARVRLRMSRYRSLGLHPISEDWQLLNKKLRQASNVRQWLKAMEDLKRRAQFHDESCDEDASPVKTLHWTLSAECAGSECGRSDGVLFVC